MWIFRQSGLNLYEIGYNENSANFNSLGNFTESTFVKVFEVDTIVKAIRLVNYLNGGDGAITFVIEDICGE